MSTGFYICATFLLLCLVAVLWSRGLIQAMIAFMGLSIALASCYWLLGAHFVGTLHLMVYVGGLLVLMAYAVMLSPSSERSDVRWRAGIACLSVVLFVVLLIEGGMVQQKKEVLQQTDSLTRIGFLLMKDYGIIWELVGLILLIVLVGVVRILAVFTTQRT